MTEKGKTGGGTDTLKFTDGQFTLVGCVHCSRRLADEAKWSGQIAADKRYNTKAKPKKRSGVDIVSRCSEALSG